AGPNVTTTTSPVPAFSLSRSASSTANSSYGLRMNLTPASSSDLPSEAILTRVSESGTRLMQTAIFIRELSRVSHQSSVRLQDAKPQAVHSVKSAGQQTRRLAYGYRLRHATALRVDS